MFRTMTANADPFQSACFPLAPYANRIRDAKFSFQGKHYCLKRNWDGDAHAIHGEGWRSEWFLREASASACQMSFVGGDNWPWPYSATQSVRISTDGVLFELGVSNDSDEPFPIGGGFHPYFPKYADTQLQFKTNGVLASTDLTRNHFETLPTDLLFEKPRSLETLDIDCCFAGWRSPALINQPGLGLEISVSTSAPSEWCTVYIPANEDFFCFEPISHATGAFNQACDAKNGLYQLRPGETFQFDMKISARMRDVR